MLQYSRRDFHNFFELHKNFKQAIHTLLHKWGFSDALRVWAISSVKWSILAHLKSQPRGQNFQAQI